MRRAFWSTGLLWACIGAGSGRCDEFTLSSLVGQTVDIETRDRYWTAQQVSRVVADKAGVVSGLVIRTARGQLAIKGSDIVEVYQEGMPLDLVWDPATKSLAQSLTRREERLERERVVSERLQQLDKKLWARLSSAEIALALEAHRDFLNEVRSRLPRRPFQVSESEYFFLASDLTPPEQQRVLKVLDEIHHAMNAGLGLPRNKNGWFGKCIVFAWQDKQSFLDFENEFYDPPGAGTGSKVHYNLKTGRVIINIPQSRDFEDFVGNLTILIAQGYLYRFYSNVDFPEWLQYGLAERVEALVVPGSTGPRNHRLEALEYMRRTSTVPRTYFDDEHDLDFWTRGISTGLVQFLIDRDPAKFREFVLDIKSGFAPEESLQRAFGWNYAQLLREYGRTLNIANLTLAGN